MLTFDECAPQAATAEANNDGGSGEPPAKKSKAKKAKEAKEAAATAAAVAAKEAKESSKDEQLTGPSIPASANSMEVPIFTEEFLALNKSRETELKQLRKQVRMVVCTNTYIKSTSGIS